MKIVCSIETNFTCKINYRKDSFVTHRAFCDALAEESARLSASQFAATNPLVQSPFPFPTHQISHNPWDPPHQNPNPNRITNSNAQNLPVSPQIKLEPHHHHLSPPPPRPPPPPFFREPQQQKSLIASPYQSLHLTTTPTSNAPTSAQLSATALLQKAASVGATGVTGTGTFSAVAAAAKQAYQSVGHMTQNEMGELRTVSQFDSAGRVAVQDCLGGGGGGGFRSRDIATWQKSDRLTRDFLGLTGDPNGDDNRNGGVEDGLNIKDVLTFTGDGEYQQQYDHHRQNQHQGFGFAGTATASETWGNC